MRHQKLVSRIEGVPAILPLLFDRLDAAGAKETEGIFRVPGDVNVVAEVGAVLPHSNITNSLSHSYACVSIAACTIFATARVKSRMHIRSDPCSSASSRYPLTQTDVDGAYRLWLRELREPLVPNSLYTLCIQHVDDEPECACCPSFFENAMVNPHRLIRTLRALPALNKRVLVGLFDYLRSYLETSVTAKTQMPASSLAMHVFLPAFRCRFSIIHTGFSVLRSFDLTSSTSRQLGTTPGAGPFSRLWTKNLMLAQAGK